MPSATMKKWPLFCHCSRSVARWTARLSWLWLRRTPTSVKLACSIWSKLVTRKSPDSVSPPRLSWYTQARGLQRAYPIRRDGLANVLLTPNEGLAMGGTSLSSPASPCTRRRTGAGPASAPGPAVACRGQMTRRPADTVDCGPAGAIHEANELALRCSGVRLVDRMRRATLRHRVAAAGRPGVAQRPVCWLHTG